MDKHWIVCYQKEDRKGYTPLSSPALAADVYTQLGKQGYEVSIACVFESNVYDTHPNFIPKEEENLNGKTK